ncbi:MAG TPA: AraC family transcriptional regulator [Polyangiales bacterium]|nr:AraC family transcriptional regulator [Polyangiales bacterium]
MQVSISLVRAVISAVERAGVSRMHYLALAGIDHALIERDDARLDLAAYVRALEAAMEVTQDPALGLHLGQHANSAMYHVVAHLAEVAKTLGDAIDMILRYSGILAVGFEPCLVDERELVAWRLPYLIGEHPAVRLTAEFAMTGFMRLLRHYLGERVRPTRVCFAYQAPAHAPEYRRLFGGRECFEQPFTELKFPRDWLERTQLNANRDLYTLLQSHAELELSRLSRHITTVQRIEQVLAASNPRELPTMDVVARTLDTSARTLARKLQAEGVSYAQLVEKRRSSAAKCLLAAGRLSIQEVASALGFADTPAFHKAFRRWTGLTPKQYVASVMR